MYNNPYLINRFTPSMLNPNLIRTPAIINNATRSAAVLNGAKSGGLLSKLGSSLTGIKSINWGGLINNTSKTLGIINQTIPLVKQVGPIFTNMKSMLRVASLFNDATNTNINYNNNISIKEQNDNLNLEKYSKTDYNITTNDNSPTFFINS